MNNSVSLYFLILDLRQPDNDAETGKQKLLTTLEKMPGNGILKLTVPNSHVDLIESLQSRGYRVNVRQWENSDWDVEVLASRTPDIIDLRKMEAPEPMQRILTICTSMGKDDSYLARLPHVPNMLFPHLLARGMAWCVHEEQDNSALLMVRRGS